MNMTKSEECKINVFDYITDRSMTFCLGSAIRNITIKSLDRTDKVNNLANALFYLELCIEKEAEYVMHDTENCEYSVIDFIKCCDLSVNLGCALIEIDNALDYGMNFQTDKVIERLKNALVLVDGELKKNLILKGE